MELFTEADVMSTYSDSQAVEDGVLVDLVELFGGQVMFQGRPVNRMTRHLFCEMLPFLIDKHDPLGPAATGDQMSRGHITNLRQTLQAKLNYARDTAQVGEERGLFYALPPNLWFILNELGGWSVMSPEDY